MGWRKLQVGRHDHRMAEATASGSARIACPKPAARPAIPSWGTRDERVEDGLLGVEVRVHRASRGCRPRRPGRIDVPGSRCRRSRPARRPAAPHGCAGPVAAGTTGSEHLTRLRWPTNVRFPCSGGYYPRPGRRQPASRLACARPVTTPVRNHVGSATIIHATSPATATTPMAATRHRVRRIQVQAAMWMPRVPPRAWAMRASMTPPGAWAPFSMAEITA